jgi:uncharacterized protein (TIGR03437 family)
VLLTIDDFPAPLIYLSATQINAIAPIELTADSSATLQLTVGGAALPPCRVWVDEADPGVFSNPQGGAAAVNQDGTINSAANPAPSGSYVSIWATGTGYFPGRDGQVAAAANQFCTASVLCGVELSGGATGVATPVNVTYSGAAPGLVNGVVQINFQVSGAGPYILTVGDIDSSAFTISTTP